MTRVDRIKQAIASGEYDPDGRKFAIAQRKRDSALATYYDLIARGYDRRRAESVLRHNTGWSRAKIREVVDGFEGTECPT